MTQFLADLELEVRSGPALASGGRDGAASI